MTAVHPDAVIQIRLPKPHKSQRLVLRQAQRWNVLCCGRRWGKTKLGLILACLPALQGFPVGWFAPDFKTQQELFREAARVLKKVIRECNRSEWRIELLSGGVIEFWSLHNNPDAGRSRHYKRVIIDEAAMVPHLEEVWKKAIRPTLIDLVGDAWFLSTPRGRNFFWELFQRGKEGRRGYACWQMPSDANPLLRLSELAEMRADTDPGVAEQEIDAQFLEGGAFFRTLSETRHTCLPKDLPATWRWYGGFDWGSNAPASFHLAAFDQDGHCWVSDEFYGANRTDEEIAAHMKSLILARGLKLADVPIAADPSIWAHMPTSQGYGERRVEAYIKAGLNMVKADNSRVDGWANMRRYLHRDKITFFRGRCAAALRTLPKLNPDKHNIEDVDTNEEDHAADSVRYLLAQRPLAAALTPEAKAAKMEREAQESVEKAQREKYRIRLNKREKSTDY